MREQDARGGPRFVAGVLVDDGVDRAVQQEAAGVLRQFVGDPDDVAGAAGVLQRHGNAPVAGAGTIDAEQIGMPLQQFGRQHARALAVVAPFQRGQHLKIGIFARQDLVESELAFGMIAQRQRSDDDADDALAPRQEAAHQRRRGAAGGGIVDADIMHAARIRCVRHQRHHSDVARRPDRRSRPAPAHDRGRRSPRRDRPATTAPARPPAHPDRTRRREGCR